MDIQADLSLYWMHVQMYSYVSPDWLNPVKNEQIQRIFVPRLFHFFKCINCSRAQNLS